MDATIIAAFIGGLCGVTGAVIGGIAGGILTYFQQVALQNKRRRWELEDLKLERNIEIDEKRREWRKQHFEEMLEQVTQAFMPIIEEHWHSTSKINHEKFRPFYKNYVEFLTQFRWGLDNQLDRLVRVFMIDLDVFDIDLEMDEIEYVEVSFMMDMHNKIVSRLHQLIEENL